MVVAGLAVSFSLVDVNDCGIREFLWQMLLVPHGLKQACQLATDGFAAHLLHLCGNVIGAGSFPTGHLLDCFADLFVPRKGVKLLVNRQSLEALNCFVVNVSGTV